MIFTSPSAFGLDLSDLSIKLTWLKKSSGKISLASFGRQEIKEGVIASGAIKKEPELIDLIRQTVVKAKGDRLKTKYCVVSLPETESYIRMIQMPKIKPDEIAEAIKWELEANIPVAISDIYYDWQVVAGQNRLADHLNVLIGALPKALVDPYLLVIKKAGFYPLAFEIESIATARALIKSEITSEPVMLVDLGAQRTSLIIYSGNTVWLTTSLAISNHTLIADLAKSLKVTDDEAKQMKFKIGLDSSSPESRLVYKALEPRLLELASEIDKYLAYYQTLKTDKNLSNPQIAKILLCGGGANLKGLSVFLASRLKKEVQIGNPWVNIFGGEAPAKVPDLAFDESLAYTTALGLALRGINC